MKKLFIYLLMSIMGISAGSHVTPKAVHENHDEHNHTSKKQSSNSDTTGYTSPFNMVDYFANLGDYTPTNEIGTCIKVALIQMLSYYDTFQNDNIIPEQYERGPQNATTLTEAIKNSPGTIREYFSGSGYATYNEFVDATASYNFQSRIIQIANSINYGTNDFNNYQTTLNLLYGNNTFAKVNQYSQYYTDPNLTQEDYINYIKAKLDLGLPCLVEAWRPDRSSGHLFVAYDYDENGIYTNYGWGRGSTRVPLGYSNYTDIVGVADLDFSGEHVHSDNYVINGIGHCGCGKADNPNPVYAPINLHYEGLHYSTFPIKYVWTGHEVTDMYEVVFFDDYMNVIKRFTNIRVPELTLIPDTDDDVEDEFIGLFYDVWRSYGIMVMGYSAGALRPTYYSEVMHYDKPYDYLGRVYRSQDYRTAFEQQYFFEEKTAEHHNFFAYGEVNDWDTYYSRRLRTATIENNYVVLSPRRVGAGLAYLEIDFGWAIDTLTIELGLWSDSELLRASDCTALLQFKSRSGEWVTLLDLLNDVQLPVGKDNLKTFILDLPYYMPNGEYENSTSIRVITTAPAIGNSKNTGRLVIGDIGVYEAY